MIVTWSPANKTLVPRDRAVKAAGGDQERLRRTGWGRYPADVPLYVLKVLDTKVPVLFHPVRWAEEHQDLEPIVDRFQVVEPRRISAEDYQRLSNFELECLVAMSIAHKIEADRRLEKAISARRRRVQREEGEDG